MKLPQSYSSSMQHGVVVTVRVRYAHARTCQQLPVFLSRREDKSIKDLLSLRQRAIFQGSASDRMMLLLLLTQLLPPIICINKCLHFLYLLCLFFLRENQAQAQKLRDFKNREFKNWLGAKNISFLLKPAAYVYYMFGSILRVRMRRSIAHTAIDREKLLNFSGFGNELNNEIINSKLPGGKREKGKPPNLLFKRRKKIFDTKRPAN